MLATRAAIVGFVVLLAGAARALPVETTTDLNLRAGPGVAYPALATMPAGEIVHMDVCVRGWCRVFYRGYPGWASGRHLARLPDRPFPWEGAGRARGPWPFDEPYVEPFDDPYVEPFDGPWVDPFVDPFVEPFEEPFPHGREAPEIVEIPDTPVAPGRRARPQAPPADDDVEEPGRLAVIVPLPPRAPDRTSPAAPTVEPEPPAAALDEEEAEGAPDAVAADPAPATPADRPPLYREGPVGAGGRDVL